MQTSNPTTRQSDPAPIDPALLRPVLLPFPAGRTLPGEAYTSADVFAWERRRFFDGSWVCVGRSADLGTPGDHRAIRVGDEGVLLTRDEEGVLHAFANSCRHRGHEILPCGQEANARVMVCPYHGWVYGMDGTVRAAPRFSHLPATDPAREGLVPARVAEWLGWVFVNASGEGPTFEAHVGNLEELLAPYDPPRLVVGDTHAYEVAANWKIVTENYHECYHCAQIHPELCRVTPTDSGESYDTTGYWVGGSMDLKDDATTMSISGESGGVPIPGLDPRRLREVGYIGLFPNLLISPHPDYVMTHRIEPVAPDRSRIECQWLFPPEAWERDGFDPSYAVEFWDLTNRQDWNACESVQRGVSSRGYRPGPLALEEDNVHQLLTMIARGYLDGGPALPVAPVRAGAHVP
jgi:Rieske 2Fe-2S family protein